MEKKVNDIYNICEEKLTSQQIERLIDELETLQESKADQEDKDARKNDPYYFFDPAQEIARENCEAA
jgi:hypothetical protein